MVLLTHTYGRVHHPGGVDGVDSWAFFGMLVECNGDTYSSFVARYSDGRQIWHISDVATFAPKIAGN